MKEHSRPLVGWFSVLTPKKAKANTAAVGKTYRFLQSDRTNYFHPLGFAYFPDGAHDDKDKLEPSIVPPGSGSTCNVTETCPAPKYYQDGVYLGICQ